MTDQTPPKDYEAVIRLIHDRYDDMSKTYQKISVYLTQNPNEVAVQSVNAIAEKVGIHASSFVRFAQALGYKGFKELQALFQRRLATAAPGFEARFKAMEEQLANREDVSEIGFLHDLVLQDVASLQALLEDTTQEDLAAAADLICQAKVIYIVGQLRAEPVALLLRYMLTMLGKRAVLLDSGGGLATHMARAIRPQDVLIAVSFRFYANEVVSIVEEAGQKDIPIVAITDSTLSPLAKSARVLFAVPERENTFTRSLSAPICLAQALVVAVAARVQDNRTAPRIPTATEA
jgi:DNA-binding MurR/RpiR family transcriptional regulator